MSECTEGGWSSNPNKMMDDFYYAYFGMSLRKAIIIRVIIFTVGVSLAMLIGLFAK